MVRLVTDSLKGVHALKERGAKVKELEPGSYTVSFKKGGLDKIKAKPEVKPEKRKDGDPRTTKELKALLKKQGVLYTVILKRKDLLVIADHPEKKDKIIERVRKEWQAYVKAKRGGNKNADN